MAARLPEEGRVAIGKLANAAGGAIRSLPKGVRLGVVIGAAVLLALFTASYLLDEPLRESMETRIRAPLKGYSVRLPGLHLQLVGFSLTLKGLTVYQQANPDPPIARFPVIRCDIHWREILRGKIVAEIRLERPEVRIDLRQYRTEAASPVPLREHGWQQAVEAITPFKINAVTVRDGTLTYIDRDPDKPLRLTRLNLEAGNIRNVRRPGVAYPSSFRLETAIFGTGRGIVEGNANFLAEPHPGIDARLTLDNVPLEYFKPVVARANLSIRSGMFSGSGRIEYGPEVKVTHLGDLTIDGMVIDYVHTARTAEAEKRRAEEVGKAVKEAPRSEMLLRVDRLRLVRCTVGMVNENVKRPYRVFLADADLRLTNLSNKFSQGPAEAELKGKFMGSGPTLVSAQFRPEKEGPDLDLRVKIEDTRLTDMNDLFRAYGKFDVTEGTFAFYSELQIRNDAISGYIKPFFKNVKVYDERTDSEKKSFRQLYEMLVGGVANLLRSRHRHEVAARVDISGPVARPRIDTWQIVGELVENAFFRTILPGFDEEASRSRSR
jgi:hypothetical protein